MFDSIGESINTAFRYMSEMLYPSMNGINEMLWGGGINPFDVFLGLFFIAGIVYSLIVVAVGTQFILLNLRELGNKQTLKKAILIILFLLLGAGLMVKVSGMNEYKPFHLQLVYIMNGEAQDDESIENNRAYESISKNSEFYANNVFGNKGLGNKYITFNVKEGFGNKISYLYSNPEEESYKEFLVGVYPVFVDYSKITINKGFLSNLDLYNLQRTNNIDVNFGDGFDSENFLKYLDLIYENINTESKENILPSPEELEKQNITDKYIKYLDGKYNFVGAYSDKEFPYKTDIILKEEGKEVKYILLPYYNILKFLDQEINERESGIDSLMIKDESNINKKINQLLKFSYNNIYNKIQKNFEELLDEDIYKNNSIDFVNSNDRNTTSGLGITGVNEDKLRYVITYNNYYKNKDKYDINGIAVNTKKKVDKIIEELNVYLGYYNKYIETKKKLPETLTAANIKLIETIESKLEKQKQNIYEEYNQLVKNSIEDKVATQISVLNALSLGTLYPAYEDFIGLSGDNIEEKIDDQKKALRIISNFLSQKNIYYTDKEELLINLLKEIDKLDSKLPDGYAIVNKNDIYIYSILSFVKQRDEFKFSEVSNKLMTRIFCKDGKNREKVYKKLSNLNIEINQEILNCELDNGNGQVIDAKELKDKLEKAIKAHLRKKSLTSEVNIISYLGSIGKKDNLLSNIYTSGKLESNESNKFLTSKIQFGNYSLISPLVYYKSLIDGDINNIPGIFVNLMEIKGKVYTEKGVFNLKIGDLDSWYKEIDPVNGQKYSNTLTVTGIPIVHNIVLLIFSLITQIAYVLVFGFLLNLYLILLKQK